MTKNFHYCPFVKIVTIFFTICLFSTPAVYPQTIWNREHLTGNWGGIRNNILDKGIDFSAVYTGDVFSNLAGGIKRGTVYLDNFDLTLSLNMDKILGWKGGSIFIYGLGNQGKNPSNYAGDVQTLDNIAAPSTWKIYEAWIQQNLFDEHLSLLMGLYDLNSEFQTLESSSLFLNSSHGIGIAFSQSGVNGPSIFPTTSLGLRIKYKIDDNFYIQSVILNGTAGDPNNPNGTSIIFPKNDGILSTTELQYLIHPPKNENDETERQPTNRLGRFAEDDYKAKFSAGFWMYTAKFPQINYSGANLNNMMITGDRGFYLIGEYKILGTDGINEKGLNLFGKLGFANSKINRFSSYTGFGAVYTGLFPGRESDQIGLAFAGAHNGNEFISTINSSGEKVVSSEWNIELTYLFNLFPWFSMQPDFQYIINPGTDPKLKNSFVAGLRIGINI